MELLGVAVGFGMMVLIFLLCREIMLWYWKVDIHLYNQRKMIKNQEEIIKLLNNNNKIGGAK